jgi:hypothetical protein
VRTTDARAVVGVTSLGIRHGALGPPSGAGRGGLA